MASREQHEFMNQLYLFLGNIEKVATLKLRRRSDVYKAELGPMLNEIIGNLQSNEACSEINGSVAAARENGDIEMMNYLAKELQFFNRLVEGFKSEGENEDTENDAIGAGKTIKDSIEEWLKKWLTPRWKKCSRYLMKS